MNVRDRITIAEDLQAHADRLAKEADEAKHRAAIEWQDIWQQMDDEGWDVGDDTKVGGTRYGKQIKYYGSVSDALTFNRWAAEQAPHLIQPKPRAQLINEEVQRRIDSGEEMPPGITAYPKRRVSRRAV